MQSLPRPNKVQQLSLQREAISLPPILTEAKMAKKNKEPEIKFEEKQPILSRSISMSKDRKWLIMKTIRTDIIHVNYMQKILGDGQWRKHLNINARKLFSPLLRMSTISTKNWLIFWRITERIIIRRGMGYIITKTTDYIPSIFLN